MDKIKKGVILAIIISILITFIYFVFLVNYQFKDKLDAHCKLSGFSGVFVKQESIFPRFDRFPYFLQDYFCVVNDDDTYISKGSEYILNLNIIK